MKTILVTGGAGYIGSHFCKLAKKFGHTPVVFDNLSTGHRKFVKFGPFEEGDLREKHRLTEIFDQYDFDAIVHFAAKALVGESVEQPLEYFDNNVLGTNNLVNCARLYKVRQFVFSSSCATYGVPKSIPISEDTPQKPVNPYGETKLKGEELLFKAHQEAGLSVALLRYFNVVGQDPEGELFEDHTPETHIIPNIAKAIKEDREFQIFGDDYPTQDGTCIRDYVDVNDLACVHLKALEYLDQNALLVSNVGRGEGYSVKEVLYSFEKVTGKKPKIKMASRREGDPPELVSKSDHFRKWYSDPLVSLEESIRSLRI